MTIQSRLLIGSDFLFCSTSQKNQHSLSYLLSPPFLGLRSPENCWFCESTVFNERSIVLSATGAADYCSCWPNGSCGKVELTARKSSALEQVFPNLVLAMFSTVLGRLSLIGYGRSCLTIAFWTEPFY